MPIEIITHNGNNYPKFQSEGFAAKFAFPFAQQVCRGYGVDVGPNRPEWGYKDIDGNPALLVDPAISPEYHATNLPPGRFDYVFSSHCAEHLENFVTAIDHWQDKLRQGGVLFLYLPSYENSYWRSWHNRKHIHNLSPQIIKDYLTDRKWKNIFVSGVDLNSSFMAIAEK